MHHVSVTKFTSTTTVDKSKLSTNLASGKLWWIKNLRKPDQPELPGVKLKGEELWIDGKMVWSRKGDPEGWRSLRKRRTVTKSFGLRHYQIAARIIMPDGKLEDFGTSAARQTFQVALCFIIWCFWIGLAIEGCRSFVWNTWSKGDFEENFSLAMRPEGDCDVWLGAEQAEELT